MEGIREILMNISQKNRKNLYKDLLIICMFLMPKS